MQNSPTEDSTPLKKTVALCPWYCDDTQELLGILLSSFASSVWLCYIPNTTAERHNDTWTSLESPLASRRCLPFPLQMKHRLVCKDPWEGLLRTQTMNTTWTEALYQMVAVTHYFASEIRIQWVTHHDAQTLQ